MKDVIVISAITERRHMIDEYEDQLEASGIEFHLEPISLENGIVSITARWKFEHIAKMCEKFSEYQKIIFTDAWDVLFFGTKEDLLRNIPAGPLVSAERNLWPEENLDFRRTLRSPWRYCNAGMMCGSPSDFFEWTDHELSMPNLDLMEQAYLNRKIASGSYGFNLDIYTSLFYTVSCDREDGSLRLKNGKLWNSKFDTYPQFFHFSGKCSSVPFRAMLRGMVDSLVV
jgi:hypothetical protein